MNHKVRNELLYSEHSHTAIPPGEYTFSYYSPTMVPTLVRRPWWNLFGKDSIKMVERATRHMICGIPEDEAQLIMQASNNHWNNTIARLMLRIIGKPVSMVQLENGRPVASYVSTGVLS